MSLLKIKNLVIEESRRGRWLHYRGETQKRIDAISLAVEHGHSVALVGERGSGKLPLTFALQRLHPVSEGQILFDNDDILRMSGRKFRKARREMPVLHPREFGALNPRQKLSRSFFSALSIHRLGGGRKRVHEQIEQAMEKAGAPLHLRNRRPGDMSPLEYQQAALAKALILRPRILICHEFTRGLDVPDQAEILNRLSTLREVSGIALLLMTHDLAIADHMSETIHVLSRGRIVDSGSRIDIVNHPQHQYTRNLVAASKGQVAASASASAVEARPAP